MVLDRVQPELVADAECAHLRGGAFGMMVDDVALARVQRRVLLRQMVLQRRHRDVHRQRGAAQRRSPISRPHLQMARRELADRSDQQRVCDAVLMDVAGRAVDQHQQRGIGVGVEELQRLEVEPLNARIEVGLRRLVQQAAGAQQQPVPRADRVADALCGRRRRWPAIAGVGLRLGDLPEQHVLPQHRIDFAGQRLLELTGIDLVDVQAALNQLQALRFGLEHGTARDQQVTGLVAQCERHRVAEAQGGGGELNDRHG